VRLRQLPVRWPLALLPSRMQARQQMRVRTPALQLL
jgi:hypothetical protein